MFLHLLLLSSLSFGYFNAAHAANEKEGLLVNAAVDLHIGEDEIKSSAKVILADNLDGWAVLLKDKSGWTVFVRKVSQDGDIVKMEYMIVDGKKAPDKAASSMTVVSHLGDQAELSNRVEGFEEFNVSSNVKRVRYSVKE